MRKDLSMAESDNNAPGGVNDPLKMRNTETAALKRIPASPNSASASSAARKTIKLKPLVPSSTAASSSSDGPVGTETRPVAPPSIVLNMRKPAAAQAEEPPKFMSTNTAPIGKMAKPEAEKPIQASTLQNESAPTKTVSIPRLQARNSKVAPAAAPGGTPPVSTVTAGVPKIVKPAAPAAAPGGTPPVSTVTAGVPRMVRPPAPAAGGQPPVSTVTAGVPRIVKPAASAAATGGGAPPVSTVTAGVPRIVKPAASAATGGGAPPVSTVTAGVPRMVKPAAPAAATGGGAPPVSTTTQGIQKQAIDQVKMQSGLQGAKPAIKLRPSASPTQDPSVLTPASPTIKLAPKTESAVSPVPPADSAPAPVNPAADTVSDQPADPAAAKPEDVTVTTKIPRKTLQLKPKAPVSSGAQLREQGDIANQQINSGVDEGDQTIQQSLDLEKKDEPAEGTAKKKSAVKPGTNEPNIIFSICAILAFLVVGYIVFALSAQFLSTWQGKQIPVVGFEQINQSAKK